MGADHIAMARVADCCHNRATLQRIGLAPVNRQSPLSRTARVGREDNVATFAWGSPYTLRRRNTRCGNA
ncbi:hypothetical protein GFS31_23610 [Leptolyngbya sp. BL0902]|nr:hypothetical protein GFS31_23610 [Leptolyngbya sp. BL0902]